MIDLFDYFDDVVCITIYENFERKELLCKKLQEANIKDNIRFDISCKFPQWMRNSSFQQMLRTNYINFEGCQGIYSTIRHFILLNELLNNDSNKRVLILEDDIVFRKDYNVTKYYLDRMPEDADIIQFDYNLITAVKNKNGDYLRVNSGDKCYCAGANVYSRRGIELMIKYLDTHSCSIIDCANWQMLKSSNPPKLYIPNQALCCQKYNQDNRGDNISEESLYEIYRKNGTNVEDFV